MKIKVEVEVPDEADCNWCGWNDDYSKCEIFGCICYKPCQPCIQARKQAKAMELESQVKQLTIVDVVQQSKSFDRWQPKQEDV